MSEVRLVSVVCAAVLLALGTAAPAPAQDRLLPQSRRITDEAIARDRDLIAAWQARASAISPPGGAGYARARAVALLAFVAQEYDRNNRDAVVDSSFAEAVALVTAVEQGTVPPPARMPPGIDALAPGAWQRLDSLQAADVGACAGTMIAAAQVQLLVAQQEALAGGPACAVPPVRQAEALAREAAERIAACRARATDAAPQAPPPILPGDMEATRFTAPDAVHFAFESAALTDASNRAVDQVAAVLNAMPAVHARLDAFTDPQGSEAYNRELAARRGAAVMARLIEAGVEAHRVVVVPHGRAASLGEGASVLERNARDRRVEIRLEGEGADRVRVERQREDVQVSPARRQQRERRRPTAH